MNKFQTLGRNNLRRERIAICAKYKLVPPCNILFLLIEAHQQNGASHTPRVKFIMGTWMVVKRVFTGIINRYLIIYYFMDMNTDLMILVSADTHAR